MHSLELKYLTDYYIQDLAEALDKRKNEDGFDVVFARLSLEQIELAHRNSYQLLVDKCSIKMFGDSVDYLSFCELNLELLRLIHNISALLQTSLSTSNNEYNDEYQNCLGDLSKTINALKRSNEAPFFAGTGTAMLTVMFVMVAMIQCFIVSPAYIIPFVPCIAMMTDLCRVAFGTGYQYDGLINNVEPLLSKLQSRYAS